MNAPSSAPEHIVELQAGSARLALRADLGGAIAGYWVNHGSGEVPVLRSTQPQALSHVRDAACFPLVPYSNRIGNAQFRWQGRDFRTTPNFSDAQPGYPHSIHGNAWRMPWTVARREAQVAELVYRHIHDAHWPFDFDVVQRFELSQTALHCSLRFTSLDARTQPVGLGFHPYFPKRSRSRIHAECSQRWESDATTHLPTRRVPQAGIDGEVRHMDFDHCFEGWRGAAHLRDEKLHVSVSGSGQYLVIYTPPTRDYYCVEPVSHVNNALHMADALAHGVVGLASGGVAEAWMKIEVSAAV
jgi:aldose 1-epimerase